MSTLSRIQPLSCIIIATATVLSVLLRRSEALIHKNVTPSRWWNSHVLVSDQGYLTDAFSCSSQRKVMWKCTWRVVPSPCSCPRIKWAATAWRPELTRPATSSSWTGCILPLLISSFTVETIRDVYESIARALRCWFCGRGCSCPVGSCSCPVETQPVSSSFIWLVLSIECLSFVVGRMWKGVIDIELRWD